MNNDKSIKATLVKRGRSTSVKPNIRTIVEIDKPQGFVIVVEILNA